MIETVRTWKCDVCGAKETVTSLAESPERWGRLCGELSSDQSKPVKELTYNGMGVSAKTTHQKPNRCIDLCPKCIKNIFT